MFGEGTQMIISAKDAMRHESTRWEVYRMAVQSGFYNEGPGTVGYKGFQILPEAGYYHVFQHGVALIRVGSPHVARVWVTCRVNNCQPAEANAIVKAEGNSFDCQDCGETVTQPHDCHD
jgi:hypothetical protein